MCSHVLAGIEVLCDSVAILKGGGLGRAGSLDELRRREAHLLEITASDVNEDELKTYVAGNGEILCDAGGLRIRVQDEKDVDAVIAALRKTNGKLVSVQPVRQSLEELFIEDDVVRGGATSI